MNRAVGISMVAALCALVLGCAADIILPEETPLKGEYYGTYTVTTDYGGESPTVLVNYVEFTFFDYTYVMNIDTARHTGVCFCRVDGQYSLEEGVLLREKSWYPSEDVGCSACNEELNPFGLFIKIIDGTTLILRQRIGTTMKELKLVRKASEE